MGDENTVDTGEQPIEVVVDDEQSTTETPKPKQKADAPAVEIVDDTPLEDRGRKPVEGVVDDTTEEELKQFDDKLQAKIRRLRHGYHDERRAKETSLREREAAIAYAKTLVDENNRLKEMVTNGETAFGKTVVSSSTAKLEAAKRAYKDAYESGDADQIVSAQEALMEARLEVERAKNFRPTPLQRTQVPDNFNITAPTGPDPKVVAWQQRNPWFGPDDELTSLALGVHKKLVESGVDPRTDEYYDRLDKRLRELVPHQFGTRKESNAPSVVAPQTRSTAPTRIKLTASQVAVAKRLNVPLELYARKMMEMENR